MDGKLAFALTTLAILSMLGPTNTLLATSGAMRGFRQSLPLVLAELCGYLTAVLAIGRVIGPVLQGSPWLFGILRLCATFYLGYLAIHLWRRGIEIDPSRAPGPRDVFVVTLLNPKAVIFALFVIPMKSDRWPAYTAAFSGMVVVMSVVWIYLGVLSTTGKFGQAVRKVTPRVSAGVLAGFAVLAVWTAVASFV
ncbi:MAG TPA: LysE family translocator [Rhizomicrobium sp.]|nr:LysE family translocator [Rhizomicrobium sp.]